jgi:hypothetical protein
MTDFSAENSQRHIVAALVSCKQWPAIFPQECSTWNIGTKGTSSVPRGTFQTAKANVWPSDQCEVLHVEHFLDTPFQVMQGTRSRETFHVEHSGVGDACACLSRLLCEYRSTCTLLARKELISMVSGWPVFGFGCTTFTLLVRGFGLAVISRGTWSS